MNTLTWEAVQALHESLKPALYYVTSDAVARGTAINCIDAGVPWCIVHPDDLETVRTTMHEFRLVPLSEAPPEVYAHLFSR